MKPQYIFAAVVAVCLLMVILLPNIGIAAPAPVELSAAAPVQQEQAAPAEPAAPEDQPSSEQEPQPTPLPQVENDSSQTGGGIAIPAGQPNNDTVAVTANLPAEMNTSSLDAFTASVINGQGDQLVGVYVDGHFALPVIQQPNGDDNFVANIENSLTAYARSARYGTLGLLAHNTLSGAAFFHLEPGQDVVAIFGDGRQERYRITGTQSYQALSPNEPTSNFIDLSDASQTVISHQVVFDRVYAQSGRLVFQTCIDANGIPTWGRLFVIAERS